VTVPWSEVLCGVSVDPLSDPEVVESEPDVVVDPDAVSPEPVWVAVA
jgi:hypothetical protein